MAKNPVLHRQIARRRLLARRLLPNASSRELWQPSCPLQGIVQKVFDLGARHRVVRQCRDMHATLCRLAILTRVTQGISVGVARARFELPALCQPPDPALGRPHRHATRLGELGGGRGPVSLDDRRDEVADLVAARPGHEPRHRHARAEHGVVLTMSAI